MARLWQGLCLGFLVLGLTACTSIYRNHGFVPNDDDLASVIVGVDTRASAEETLGVPTTEGVSGVNSIYYIASRWRHFGASRPKPVSREIVAIAFDKDDVVTNVSRYGLDDGQVVVLSRRVTEGGANEISFIRQLMGNFGNLDGGALFGG